MQQQHYRHSLEFYSAVQQLPPYQRDAVGLFLIDVMESMQKMDRLIDRMARPPCARNTPVCLIEMHRQFCAHMKAYINDYEQQMKEEVAGLPD